MKLRTLLLVGNLSLTGCAYETVCAGVGLERVTPIEPTIAVGASFTARYEEGGTCTPGHVTAADYHAVPLTWRTPDTLVVAVDAVTGRVTGKAVGDARISSDERGFMLAVHVR
jgi:hypothetical protein